MSSKFKNLSLQIQEMEEANSRLSEYEKLFEKACQINFGMSPKAIRKLISENQENKDKTSN